MQMVHRVCSPEGQVARQAHNSQRRQEVEGAGLKRTDKVLGVFTRVRTLGWRGPQRLYGLDFEEHVWKDLGKYSRKEEQGGVFMAFIRTSPSLGAEQAQSYG